MEINLAGLPWFLGQVIQRTLANPKCSADMCLVMAEALDEAAKELPAQTVWLPPCTRVATSLRAAAPHYAAATGKPHGDFDGTLTP